MKPKFKKKKLYVMYDLFDDYFWGLSIFLKKSLLSLEYVSF